MIDLHCHILPAIDDGPDNIETSLAMCRMAVEDGVTHVTATPHFRYGEHPTRDEVESRVLAFQARVRDEGIPLTIGGGADVRLTYELFEAIRNGGIPTVNGSRYFLLELPDLIPPHVEDFIFEARVKGLFPIITHPERNYSILAKPEIVKRLRDAGALMQITALSITGGFGKNVLRLTQFLLKKNLVDVVASDAHGTGRRSPVLSTAFRHVTEQFGSEMGQRFFLETPQAVIDDLPYTC